MACAQTKTPPQCEDLNRDEKTAKNEKGQEGDNRACILAFRLQSVFLFSKVCLYFFPEAITSNASCGIDVCSALAIFAH